MTDHDYNCLVVYLTPVGSRRSVNLKVRAPDHPSAIAICERRLQSDKRRAFTKIVDWTIKRG